MEINERLYEVIDMIKNYERQPEVLKFASELASISDSDIDLVRQHYSEWGINDISNVIKTIEKAKYMQRITPTHSCSMPEYFTGDIKLDESDQDNIGRKR
ncbi:MAG: hypothetical protein PHI22_02875 [Bacilli bacterium]|nr:hypothetical protein [Bacilli bacterium]MDD4298768.1 hypothetical protein [Bacilli bacterium]MDD4644225.1 hypothetical protein [Bacilli bacterium]